MKKLNVSPPIVLIIHGFACRKERYAELKKIIEKSYPGCDPIIPDFALPLFSTTHPNKIVNDLLQVLDNAWEAYLSNRHPEDQPPEIIIIGHSAGSLLARKLYIVARGENPNCPFETGVSNKKPKEWAKQVARIILIAGVNNGWTTTHHLNNMKAISIGLGILLGHIVEIISFKKPFAFQIRKGSPFISNLRTPYPS